VEITLTGTYKKGRHSVDGYLRQVAIANPHARITWIPPSGETPAEPECFRAGQRRASPEPKGDSSRTPMEWNGPPDEDAQGADEGRTLRAFLQNEFSA